MNSQSSINRNAPGLGAQGQQGVALAVVLILLVVMTLLGLVAVRGTLMQEHMSASQYDRSLSFQSAEAALRDAEVSVANTMPTVPTSGCALGICATPVPTGTYTAPWLDDSMWSGTNSIVATTTVGDLTTQARYIIEYMGLLDSLTCTTSGDVSETACLQKDDHYRITARSSAANRADVTLQSNFLVPHAP